VGISRVLWTMYDNCKISDGTRIVVEYLKNILIPCFGAGCVWEWRNIPQTVHKKYTSFSTERIVALGSVNNIFPENYDFAARHLWYPVTVFSEFVSQQKITQPCKL
jgi:hypothetical protein